jgi:hypothetical protein
MLITTHGDAAEEKAQLKITAARENHNEAELIVWTAILAKIEGMRSQD